MIENLEGWYLLQNDRPYSILLHNADHLCRYEKTKKMEIPPMEQCGTPQ